MEIKSLSGCATEYAYAKINTFLAVTGQRENGYHELLSHMQALTLCDTLTMSWHPTGEGEFIVLLRCDADSLPCDSSNLVVRAANALALDLAAKDISISGTLEIELEKRIPMAAGLAGGSADAAAILRGFNTLLSQPLSIQELCTIGASLGADIPFCLLSEGHPAMAARGIGELLTPAVSLPDSCSLVVACDGEGVSTPWAYRRLDEAGQCSSPSFAEKAYTALSEALLSEKLSCIASHSYNCFESVVLPERPAACALMEYMTESGAVFARMSGSGPSIVGYFDNATKASDCVDALVSRGIRAYLTKPLR